MSYLTCISCRETFETPAQQREHYHTDYHRFNAKRKIVDLPPVSEAVFLQKVEELHKKQTTKQTFTGQCLFCKKTFSNESTYKNHILSKKHQDREKQAKLADRSAGLKSSIKTTIINPETQETPEVKLETVQTEEELMQEKVKNAHRFELNECLFCSRSNNSFEENIEHMTKHHGFFIPDIEFMSNLEGFISYLGEKIGTGNVCLHCDKMFATCESVQAHMASLSHAKLPADDCDEYDDFYDFSSTWENDEDDEVPEGEIQDEDRMQLVAKTGKGIIDIDDDGFTLTLGSGRRIGHRDLVVYYKQNYRRIADRDPRVLKSAINNYKAIGWHTTELNSARRARMEHDKVFRYNLQQVSVKANKLQKHYRAQVMC